MNTKNKYIFETRRERLKNRFLHVLNDEIHYREVHMNGSLTTFLVNLKWMLRGLDYNYPKKFSISLMYKCRNNANACEDPEKSKMFDELRKLVKMLEGE